MGIPIRTASLAGIPQYPLTVIFDGADSNPVSYVQDHGVNCGIILNLSAGLDTNGLLNLTNFLAAGGVNTTQLAAGAVTEAKLNPATSNALNALRVGKWTYSFAVNGGAVSSIPLTGPTLPQNAVILGGNLDVTTIVAGSGATCAIQVESANDIISAAAVSGAPWSSTGLKAIVPVFTAATYKKTTTNTRVPNLVVTAAVLSAGIFNLQLVYIVDDA